MSDSIERICKRLAVRISIDSGKTLIGSGNLLTCEMMGYALIFTAAHVLDGITEEKLVHFCFEDENGEQKIVELNLKRKKVWSSLSEKNTGYIYVHPEYNCRKKSYPVNDGAIICVPFYTWMRNMPIFEISEYEDGKAILVGFPKDDDTKIENESDFEFVTYRSNIYCNEVKVTEQHKIKNFVLHGVRSITDPFISIERGLDGLSGGGILTKSVRGLRFHGVFLSDKNKKISYFALSSTVFLDIMETYKIRVELPHDINAFLMRAVNFFDPYGNTKALNWLINNAKDYIPKEQLDVFFSDIFKDSRFLSCDNHRPLCPYYYSNKLIVKVLIGKVFSLEPDRINNQAIHIGSEEKEIHVEHICSESPIRQIVTELFENGAVSENGFFRNSSIFIVSDNNIERRNKEEVTRKQCRNIVYSIVNSNMCDEEYSWIDQIGFSITYGDPININIGFIGIGRLEEKMFQAECQETMYSSIKELITNVWRA